MSVALTHLLTAGCRLVTPVGVWNNPFYLFHLRVNNCAIRLVTPFFTRSHSDMFLSQKETMFISIVVFLCLPYLHPNPGLNSSCCIFVELYRKQNNLMSEKPCGIATYCQCPFVLASNSLKTRLAFQTNIIESSLSFACTGTCACRCCGPA